MGERLPNYPLRGQIDSGGSGTVSSVDYETVRFHHAPLPNRGLMPEAQMRAGITEWLRSTGQDSRFHEGPNGRLIMDISDLSLERRDTDIDREPNIDREPDVQHVPPPPHLMTAG